jgi:hypothetical protein
MDRVACLAHGSTAPDLEPVPGTDREAVGVDGEVDFICVDVLLSVGPGSYMCYFLLL